MSNLEEMLVGEIIQNKIREDKLNRENKRRSMIPSDNSFIENAFRGANQNHNDESVNISGRLYDNSDQMIDTIEFFLDDYDRIEIRTKMRDFEPSLDFYIQEYEKFIATYEAKLVRQFENETGSKKEQIHLNLKAKLLNIKASFIVQLITKKFMLEQVLVKNQFAKDYNSNLIQSKISQVISQTAVYSSSRDYSVSLK